MPSPINSYGQSGGGVSQGGVDRTSSETAGPTDDGRADHGAKCEFAEVAKESRLKEICLRSLMDIGRP